MAERSLDDNNLEDWVAQFVTIAHHGLPAHLKQTGLFCFDLDTTTSLARGESVRYSLIALLGLLKRQETGAPLSVAVDGVLAAVDHRRHELVLGDLALRLWIDVRRGADAEAAKALADLEARVQAGPSDRLEGLEVAWWVTAAALAVSAGLPADNLLRSGIGVLTSRRSNRSPLFRHLGSGWRADYPNFATQIYSLLALAELARADLFDQAERWAVQLADTLVELRLDDGGWPWLYHADRASVIEPYEIYSVHQDAMAPMAFFALAEATNRIEYARAALDGVPWCFGRNELGIPLVEDTVINRSIRRRGGARQLNLYGNTLLAGPLGRRARLDRGPLEVNRTCRPYHLGWILEAWSGREDLVATAVEASR